MPLFLRWLINTVALIIVAWLVGGIEIAGLFSAFVASAFIGLLNVVIRPLLILLTLPLNVLTLGLFTFVINGLMLLLASRVLDGFKVAGFWTAVWGALLLSIVSYVISAFFSSERGGVRFTYTKTFRRRRPKPGQDSPPRNERPIDLEPDKEGRWR